MKLHIIAAICTICYSNCFFLFQLLVSRTEPKCPVPHGQSDSKASIKKQSASPVFQHGASVMSAFDELKNKGGEATDVDYNAFADEITKWLADSEQQPNSSDVDY